MTMAQNTKYTYIKRSIKGNYVEFDEQFDEELYNNIGETWEDYLNDKWVLLSNEQLEFKAMNPNASVLEVFNMSIAPIPPKTIAEIKEEKIADIDKHDQSESVNGFNVVKDGNTVTAWLTKEERANYRSSIEAAELAGIDTLHLFIADMPIELGVQTAKMMLAQIQLYADQCYIVTKQHKAEVMAMDNGTEIMNYDVTVGYPTRLTFTI